MLGSTKKQTKSLSDIPQALVKAVKDAQRTFCRSGYKPEKNEDDAFSYFWSQTLPQCVPQRTRSTSLMSPEISRRRSLSRVSISADIVPLSPKRPIDQVTLGAGNQHVMFALAYILRLKRAQIILGEDSFRTHLKETFDFEDPAFADDVTEIWAFYRQLLEVLSNQHESMEMVDKFSATSIGITIREQLSQASGLADVEKPKKCKTQQDIVRLLVDAIRTYDLDSTPYTLSSDRGYPSFSASSSSIPSSKPKPSRSGFFSCCCSADDSDDEEQSEHLLTVTSYDKYAIN
jgi:hypothetical protein